MSTIVSNLYPPIVHEILPSFIRTGTCRIYFALPEYNSASDIKNVQISLINQKTNITAFNTDTYPSGIKISTLNLDDEKDEAEDFKYYVDIPVTDLTDEEFLLNQFYIAQLRFTSSEAAAAPVNNKLDNWLYEYRDYFSEWSSICLIKGIQQPQILITGLVEDDSIMLPNALSKVVGKLYYTNNRRQQEYLKSYNIEIEATAEGKTFTIIKTDEITTSLYNPNEFHYDVTYDLSTWEYYTSDLVYTLKFTYTTNNLFTETKTFYFTISDITADTINGVMDVTPEQQDGRIKIEIDFEGVANKTDKNLIIKRSSSRSNFHIWENLKTIPNTANDIKFIWYDTSIESGIWYKYRVQQEKSSGKQNRLQIEEPVMCAFEDMFLTNKDKQLKIQFNPTVSNFKYNVTEAQQVTLGSPYPYIKRNGDNYYRSFSIGGLISALMDDGNWYRSSLDENGNFIVKSKQEPFTSTEEVYQDSKNLYIQYNNTNDISQYQDYIYEKQFRQKVFDFLYENSIKLFRSATEGNILVKLMNISFQPLDALGRRLYSFTADAVEINAATAENYIKYDIINKNYYSYTMRQLNQIFQGYEPILTTIVSSSNFLRQNKELLKFKQLQFFLRQNASVIVYIKTLRDATPVGHELNRDVPLTFTFDDDNPIETCYFYTIADPATIQAIVVYKCELKGVN